MEDNWVVPPRTFDIEGCSWYVEPLPDVNIRFHKAYIPESIDVWPPSTANLTPLTLIGPAHASEDESQWLQKKLADIENDRAYHSSFGQCVLYQRDERHKIDDAQLAYLRQRGCTTFAEIKIATGLPCENKDGIYCMIGQSLHRVYKLYSDPYKAFVFGVVHDQRDPTHYLDSEIRDEPPSQDKLSPAGKKFHKLDNELIPVPHRYNAIYQRRMTRAPLAGLTVAIKDVIDMAGVPTIASSKAYQSLYGDAHSTATVINQLTSLGAIIIGKTKTAQLASGEMAADWVDFECPINPRGDGSFEAYCSSTGSAAAVAAYDWLDAAIGTDTLGSIVQPAAGYGIFGLRPTHRSHLPGVDDSGCLKVSPLLDTIGTFSRSLRTLRVMTECVGGLRNTKATAEAVNIQRLKRSFSKLLYSSASFSIYPEAKKDLFNDFCMQLLRPFHPSARYERKFDIDAEWKRTGISNPNTSIYEYLGDTLAHIQLHDCFRNNLLFRTANRETHGCEPKVNPMIEYKWKLGSRITTKQYSEAHQRQDEFRRFLTDNIFDEGTVLVLPASPPELLYREGEDL